MEFKINIKTWYDPKNHILFKFLTEDQIVEKSLDCDLTISCGNRIATRHVQYDIHGGQEEKDYIQTSALHLAQWFLMNFWRICYEPTFRGVPLSWRMAHEIPAIGEGFVWPHVTFSSNKKNVNIVCNKSKKIESGIFYTTQFGFKIPRDVFIQEIYRFVNVVLDRLEEIGEKDSELLKLWNELLDEKNNPDTCAYRIIEAGLGFDPDEGNQVIINNLVEILK